MKLPSISNVPLDASSLVRWLSEFKNSIFDAFKTVNDYDVLYAEPAKLKIGMVRYFGGAVAATAIASEGLWVYQSTGWVKAA